MMQRRRVCVPKHQIEPWVSMQHTSMFAAGGPGAPIAGRNVSDLMEGAASQIGRCVCVCVCMPASVCPRPCLKPQCVLLLFLPHVPWAFICISYRPSIPPLIPPPGHQSFLFDRSCTANLACSVSQRGPSVMDRSSKLADLTLVSKYYPVANYSYPRNEALVHEIVGTVPKDRSSLGSEGSAPGLIDDRTDSEVSLDDDYQYHAHAAEIWDSFWQPGQEKFEKPRIHPRKQYPALIPSPQHRTRQQGACEPTSPAWPLPENPTIRRHRRPAATYSPFPKPLTLPPRSTSTTPSWTNSRPPSGKLSASLHSKNDSRSSYLRPLTPANLASSATEFKRETIKSIAPSSNYPVTPLETRPSTSLGVRPASSETPALYSRATTSSTDLPMHDINHTPASSYFPHLAPPEPEPHSVFEDDDSESESQGRSFFRFHKRNESDTRRAAKAAESTVRRRRTRASTAPSSPAKQQPERSKTPTPARKRPGGEVLSRMLGRRSR